jgi:hypothetical protein
MRKIVVCIDIERSRTDLYCRRINLSSLKVVYGLSDIEFNMFGTLSELFKVVKARRDLFVALSTPVANTR